MITPSGGAKNYWNAIRAGNPIHVEMLFSKGTLLTESDIDISTGITIQDLMNSDSDLAVGKSVCKQFTARIFLNDNIRNIDWQDRFRLRFGVEIGGTTSWLTVGYFNGVKPKRTVGIDQLDYIAYDDMIKFEASAQSFIENTTFPISAEDLLYAIGQEVGVAVNSVSLSEPSYVLEAEMVENDIKDFNTYRDIIESFAEATCTYARISNAGTCEFVWYGDEQSAADCVTIGRTDQFSVDHNDVYGRGLIWDQFDGMSWYTIDSVSRRWGDMLGHYSVTNAINSVWIENKYGTDSSAGSGNNQYWIVDNVFMKDGNNTSATWYLTRFQNFGGQLPMTVECIGNWMLETGDYVDVVLEENIVIHMPIYNRTLHYNGTITDTLETTGELFNRLK